MRVAVAYDQGNVWQHFGQTSSFKFFDIEDGQIIRTEVVPTGNASHGALADFLADHQVNAVICGGVGSPMIARLNAAGIQTYPGVTGSADERVRDLLHGTLTVRPEAVHEGCHHHG